MADELFKTADLSKVQDRTATNQGNYTVANAPAQPGLLQTPPPAQTPSQDTGLFSTTATPDQATPQATAAQPSQADSVAQQLNALLETNNPYLSAARESAQRASASRGLQNSSIAATAGEKAAIESALPIAQQDAGHYQTLGQQTNQGKIQEGLYQTQGDISSRLQAEQAANTSNLSAQEHAQAQQIQATEMEWKKFDLSQRIGLEYDQKNEDVKAKFNDLANAIGEDYMNDFMELAVNPNFESDDDRQKAIDILTATYNQRYQMAADIAGYELEWETPSIGFDVNAPSSSNPQPTDFEAPATWDLIEIPGGISLYEDENGKRYTLDGKPYVVDMGPPINS